MYIEYFLIIVDYYKTLTRRILLFEWLIPVSFALLLVSLNNKITFDNYKIFKDSSLNILGVLLGFSIAVITIITTGSGKNIENIKSIKTDFKLNNDFITLYDLILINFTYSVIVEIIIIVSCLVFPMISAYILISHKVKLVLYSMMLILVVHILFLTIRNLTDFYLIVRSKAK